MHLHCSYLNISTMTCCRSFWLCQRDLTSSSALPHDESLWTFCTSHSHFRHFLRFTRPTLILILVPFRWPWRHDGHAATAPNRTIVVWNPGALGESSKQFFIQYYDVLYNVLTKDKKSYPGKEDSPSHLHALGLREMPERSAGMFQPPGLIFLGANSSDVL